MTKRWIFLAVAIFIIFFVFPSCSSTWPPYDNKRTSLVSRRDALASTPLYPSRKPRALVRRSPGGLALSDSTLQNNILTRAALQRRSDGNGSLQRRAPKLYSKKELEILRWCAAKISTYLEEDDIVFGVGNSGSYLLIPFKHGSFNMHSLPISSTRDYYKLGNIPTNAGLKRYYEQVLHPKLKKAPFDRIVLLDHSGTGQSVDGFRRAFHDIVQAGYPEILDDIMNIPMVLINVIDEYRRPNGKLPPTDPKNVPVLAKFYPPGKGVLNAIVGGVVHPRVTPDYRAPNWENPIKDSWRKGEKAAAQELEQQIVDYCQKNGGLVTKNEQPPRKKKLPDRLLKLLLRPFMR